jgi:acyl-CoA synthetase (NDP forming)
MRLGTFRGDGRRFLSVLRRIAAAKPVVIWKGGRTEEGVRAIASHTGSLAISQAVWRAAVRQCGAISVTERMAFILRVRKLARQCAKMYIEQREGLGFPLLKK